MYVDNGYLVLKGFFSSWALSAFESRIVELYARAAKDLDLSVPEIAENYDILCAILEEMESEHKPEAYAVQRLVETDIKLKKLFDEVFMNATTNLIAADGEHLKDCKIRGPGLFINRPKTQRLLYKWHSERHYYPEFKRFVNCHFPLFKDKTAENGAMSVMPGSHKGEWTQKEYSSGKNAFYQREITEDQLADYTPKVIEEKRRDLTVFHANLVHRSNENTSDKYSFAAVCRVYEVN